MWHSIPHIDGTQNAYRGLLNFAFRTYEDELQRISTLASKRPQSPSEWGPQFREKELQLRMLYEGALRAGDPPGFNAEEVERRVRGLRDAITALLLWQRDAWTSPCQEGQDPVSVYFSARYRLMLEAWEKVETLAIRAESVLHEKVAREVSTDKGS
jgi:hypothetical protein